MSHPKMQIKLPRRIRILFVLTAILYRTTTQAFLHWILQLKLQV